MDSEKHKIKDNTHCPKVDRRAGNERTPASNLRWNIFEGPGFDVFLDVA
jgi:hypothetical protein